MGSLTEPTFNYKSFDISPGNLHDFPNFSKNKSPADLNTELFCDVLHSPKDLNSPVYPSPNSSMSYLRLNHLSLDDCSTQSSTEPEKQEINITFTNKSSENNTPCTTNRISPSTQTSYKIRKNSTNMVQPIMNEPTLIKSGKLTFLILDAPSDNNIKSYVEEMQSYGITDLVRTNSCNYDKTLIANANIKIHDLFFDDGSAPPDSIILKWMDIVKSAVNSNGAIAVHCVAGLGRAPVLVSIALIEYGMAPSAAISYIRERRKGALNRIQLHFLISYKSPRKVNCFQRCTIM